MLVHFLFVSERKTLLEVFRPNHYHQHRALRSPET